MAYSLDKEGELRLKLGENLVRVLYRRPDPAELIETLVQKMPRGDEAEDALRILMANLELGRDCITGVGEGDLMIDGNPLGANSNGAEGPDWKERIAEACPLVLIALGQHLSAVPAVMGETGLKKS